MNSKERVLRAVARQDTDRVPLDFSADRSVIDRLQADIGVSSEEDLLCYLNVDLRVIYIYDYTGPQKFTADGREANPWGIVSGGPSYAEDLGYRPLAACGVGGRSIRL